MGTVHRSARPWEGGSGRRVWEDHATGGLEAWLLWQRRESAGGHGGKHAGLGSAGATAAGGDAGSGGAARASERGRDDKSQCGGVGAHKGAGLRPWLSAAAAAVGRQARASAGGCVRAGNSTGGGKGHGILWRQQQ